MNRSYFDASLCDLSDADPIAVLGTLVSQSPFGAEPNQRDAWEFEVELLQSVARELRAGHVFLEFTIPRMGKRADAVVLYRGLIFVIEFKVGESAFSRADLDQTLGYAIDLKNFHEASHDRRIVPLLLATKAPATEDRCEFWSDGVSRPLRTNGADLARLLIETADEFRGPEIDPTQWANARYKPTPTIIEAAQALYRQHDVKAITRTEAGAENLTRTAAYIGRVIDNVKASGRKAICFVTGVPGSGKTLAGLNLANERKNAHADEHAVFLSGNGPLVDVLREALAQDAHARKAIDANDGAASSREEERSRIRSMIQNIHHFRDDNVRTTRPPIERVVIFDEAQRAWSADKAGKFMRERGHANFATSEPEFLLSVMARHEAWCTVVCLVGGGQEINTGEAGISEWLDALSRSFPDWEVHVSSQIRHPDYLTPHSAAEFLGRDGVHTADDLHLSVSVRSFRAEKLSDFVGAVIEADLERSRDLLAELLHYPIVLTRDLSKARAWLRVQRRGTERAGLLASSNALRLKPEGIFVKAKIDPAQWFLAPSADVRSCDILEDVATEFDVQGLELDWACVCWDANFRWTESGWEVWAFRGTKWTTRSEDLRSYTSNAYRVLLTRARQGMVIFVPQGDEADATRNPSLYNQTFELLRSVGLPEF